MYGYRGYRVGLTNHAWERYIQRSNVRRTGKKNRARVAAFIEYRLNDHLGLGVHVDPTGAVWVELTPVLWASVRLEASGWTVTSIMDWGEKKEA